MTLYTHAHKHNTQRRPQRLAGVPRHQHRWEAAALPLLLPLLQRELQTGRAGAPLVRRVQLSSPHSHARMRASPPPDSLSTHALPAIHTHMHPITPPHISHLKQGPARGPLDPRRPRKGRRQAGAPLDHALEAEQGRLPRPLDPPRPRGRHLGTHVVSWPTCFSLVCIEVYVYVYVRPSWVKGGREACTQS